MVYAMLSSGISWERVEKDIDESTGRILSIDKIFQNYDADEHVCQVLQGHNRHSADIPLSGLRSIVSSYLYIPEDLL